MGVVYLGHRLAKIIILGKVVTRFIGCIRSNFRQRKRKECMALSAKDFSPDSSQNVKLNNLDCVAIFVTGQEQQAKIQGHF